MNLRKQYARLNRIEGNLPESLEAFEGFLKRGLLLSLMEKGYLTDVQCIQVCKKLTKHD